MTERVVEAYTLEESRVESAGVVASTHRTLEGLIGRMQSIERRLALDRADGTRGNLSLSEPPPRYSDA